MVPGDGFIWIDGALVHEREAVVSVLDHGLVVGDGAFETLQVVDGTPFASRRHIRRLHTTLAGLAISAPDEALLRRAMSEVIDANAAAAARLRVTVTGGLGPLGSGEPFGPPRLIMAVQPLGPQPVPRAVTVPWTRNESGALAGLKTTSYAENVRALRYAHAQGAGEALFANTKGELCEGTGTNVFVAVAGRLLTPPLSSGCLAGITRELLLELVAVEETALLLDVLDEADEVFVASTVRGVQAMEQVDDRTLPGPGPLTIAAAAAFAKLMARDLDP